MQGHAGIRQCKNPISSMHTRLTYMRREPCEMANGNTHRTFMSLLKLQNYTFVIARMLLFIPALIFGLWDGRLLICLRLANDMNSVLKAFEKWANSWARAKPIVWRLWEVGVVRCVLQSCWSVWSVPCAGWVTVRRFLGKGTSKTDDGL